MKAVRRATTPPGQPHRHAAGLLQEHDEEPVPGLPEKLPKDEQILWQGAPQWRVMAREAFHLRKLTVYFGLIGVLRLIFLVEEGTSGLELAKGMAPFLTLAFSGLLILLCLAWLSARYTMYTVTNRRVVMRIGIVLTVTYNIPFSRITGANVRAGPDGTGDLALEIDRESRIPYLQLWPHARAWHLQNPQPTLRGIMKVQQVSALLTEAWSQARGLRLPAAQGIERRPDAPTMPKPAHQA